MNPVTVEKMYQPTGIDSRMIAGEIRVVRLSSNVTPASSGASTASPIDVFELLRMRIATATMAMMIPNTRRLPGWTIS